MLRTAAAIAALGLTAGLYLTSGTAMAEPLANDPKVEAARPEVAGKTAAEVRITNAKPEEESLVNPRNGKVLTLEMVHNDARWQRETAEMLKRDQTSEAVR